ncbi:MAG: polyprenyl synthetase family protein, partial [Armatimonadetes bacterium]|nr:polyprenyl synthetase family protein [Armatimonadota bacterium]
MDDQQRLTAYRSLVDARLDVLLPPSATEPSPLHEAMRYSALAPGKRLRPSLCLAACEAVGGAPAEALDAGCALELVHTFSLIHDDLPSIDDDDLRRGRPTCHVQFGEAMAVLAGDALFALAFEVLSHCHAESSRVVAAVRAVSEATGSRGLVGGETMDILAEGTEAGLDHLKEIHRRKTGALISASCVVGAVLGGATDDQLVAMRRFGDAVGLAFQIHDDVLNVVSTAEELGKATGSDAHKKKLTYPSVIGLEASRQAAREATSAALESLVGFADPSALRALAEFSVDR